MAGRKSGIGKKGRKREIEKEREKGRKKETEGGGRGREGKKYELSDLTLSLNPRTILY